MLDTMTNATTSSPAADQGEVVEPSAGTHPEPSKPEPPADADRRDWRHPSINGVVLLLLLVVAVRIGLQPLHDNSFLTHLSTGRLILDHGSVPRTDPYSWTAYGHAWTVQSWAASVAYAGMEKAFGLLGIRLLDTVMCLALVAILWRLTKPAGGLLARAIPAGLVTCMGTGLWVERPLLFGAVALALVVLAGEDALDPRWLVPVMWVWVNTHGSFPFGLVLLGLLALGRWLDQRVRPRVELRALGWATLGTLLGAVNPLGWRLLIFPAELISHRQAFNRVSEWQPPHFHRGVEQFFALQLVLVVVLLLVRHRRWRAILPVIFFGAMALSATRNILQASIVFTPIMAVAASGLGTIEGKKRPRLIRPVFIALAVLGLLVGIRGISEPSAALHDYPAGPAAWMRDHHLMGVHDRVVSRDWVGNWLEFKYGPDEVRVFMDDRVDMYPLPVIEDFTAMLDQGQDYQKLLSRYRPTAVLWARGTPMGTFLQHSPHWRVVHRDKKWLVAVPRP